MRYSKTIMVRVTPEQKKKLEKEAKKKNQPVAEMVRDFLHTLLITK